MTEIQWFNILYCLENLIISYEEIIKKIKSKEYKFFVKGCKISLDMIKNLMDSNTLKKYENRVKELNYERKSKN